MAYQCVIFSDLTDLYYTRAAGAYRIATELRDAGYSVRVIDFLSQWSIEQLYQAIDRFIGPETLMVGWASMFFGYVGRPGPGFRFRNEYEITHGKASGYMFEPELVEDLISRIRDRASEVRFVMGGDRAKFSNTPYVDYFVEGPGDHAIIHLIKHLDEHHPLGPHRRNPNGSITINAVRDYPVEEFNHDIRYVEEDFIDPRETLILEVARGCIFKCSFCSYALNGKARNQYIKDIGLLREEMERNYHLWGTTGYIIGDDTLNDATDKVKSIHDLFTTLSFEPEYTAYARVDILNKHRDMIPMLKDSGLRSVTFGIETMNHETGKLIGKGLDPEITKRILHDIKSEWKDEVKTQSGFIAGLPGETIDSLYRTQEWLMSDDCSLHRAHWYPLYMANPDMFALTYTSKLEEDPDKYKYTVHGVRDWENPQMNYAIATGLSKTFNIALDEKNHVAGLPYLSNRNSIGVNDPDWTCRRVDFPSKIRETNMIEMTQNYINRILSY